MVESIAKATVLPPRLGTAGIDLGDRVSEVCVYAGGAVLERFQFAMTPASVRAAFCERSFERVALEAGAQSGWVTRELRQLGYEPIVANPRKVKAISTNERKSDKNDALLLAKLAAADPTLLHPIHHRSGAGEAAYAVLKARSAAVKARGSIVQTIRSLAKGVGCRLKKGSIETFGLREAELPPELRPACAPLFAVIAMLTEQIASYDDAIDDMVKAMPGAMAVKQVKGVGPLTALAFVLTLEDPARFRNGRAAAAFVGLAPRRDQSGNIDRQLGISKTGSSFLRRHLVQCAQYIMGPFGVDCDLRRWGEKLCARGGKNAKKRAVVAVARKLTVLMFQLWVGRQPWQPLYNSERANASAAVSSPKVEDGPDTRSKVTARSAMPNPRKRNVARQIAAPVGPDPSMHRAPEAPTNSADRSVVRGTPASTLSPKTAASKRAPLTTRAPSGDLARSEKHDDNERQANAVVPLRRTAERSGKKTGSRGTSSPSGETTTDD